MNRLTQHKLFGVIGISIVLFTTGCDESFQPWQENDRYHFSIYGMLDASVDTQWVRIMPVREELFLEPRPIDVTVTLEHIESGDSIAMNDSLFRYYPELYAWNFWTTMDLEPEQTYRLTAKHGDGRTSSAQVKLPSDFPTPIVRMRQIVDDSEFYNIVYISKSIDLLADVQVIYFGLDEPTGIVHSRGFGHLKDTVRTSHDYHTVYIDPREDGLNIDPIIKEVVFVANAGPDFHDFGSMDEKILTVPEGVSNIENGVGYLAGIVSKTVPYRSCFADDGFTYIPCPLVPDPW
ncbi:MAG: hypothetical protein WD355_11150 [Balneolaceae bacterium]